MASQFTDFLRSTRNRYSKYVSDGILEDYVLFKELQKANGPPKRYSGTVGNEAGIISGVGGTDFEWRVWKDHISAGSWGPSHPITPSIPQILGNPKLSMGGYHVQYAMDLFATLSLEGDEAFLKLAEFYEAAAARRWYKLFNAEIYTDNSGDVPPGWTGLAAFIATTGTYANNITLSDTYAKPYKFDYSGSGQSFGVTCMDRFTEVVVGATHGDSQTAGDSAPQVAFMNRTDWQKMKSVIEDTRHVQDVDTEMLKLGFKQFVYTGVRTYWDDEMTSQAINKIYALNMTTLGLAHATKQLFHFLTGETVEGPLQIVNVGVHKGQIFCGNTRKNGLIDNTASI